MTRRSVATTGADSESQEFFHLLTPPRIRYALPLFQGDLLVGVNLSEPQAPVGVVADNEVGKDDGLLRLGGQRSKGRCPDVDGRRKSVDGALT